MSLDYAEDLIEALKEQKEEYVLLVFQKNQSGDVIAHVSYNLQQEQLLPYVIDNLKYLAKKLKSADKPKETSAE